MEPGAGEAVAPGVVKQVVVAPNRKAMDPLTAVDISQVGWATGKGDKALRMGHI